MQLQLVRATAETRQLDDIVRAFTPPMRRVCRHMADAALREMIERMAQRQLTRPRRRTYQRASDAMTPGTSSSSSRAR